MNPPFSNATPWARKFMAHGNGVALMPVSRAKWLVEIWNMPEIAVMLTPLDLNFIRQMVIRKLSVSKRFCLV
jgi:hypothetical protein